NQRVKAMIDANIDIPIVCKQLTGYTEKEKKAINVKANIPSGEWDYDILDSWSDDLNTFDFNDKEFNIEKIEEVEGEDDIPEVNETTVKLGDLYKLGRHKLLCGDSTKEECYEKLLNGNKIDMIFTDPPYSVNYTKKSKEVLKSKNYVEIKNDNMSTKKTAETIWKPVFANMYNYAKDSCSYYMTMPQGGDQMMMMMMMMSENWQVKHELIWVKETPVFSMGRLDYDYKHEPIMYGWKKKREWYGNGEHTKSVWQIKRTENKLHPTMKPVALIENAILNSSKKDMNIMDVFGGSGSTLIACEKQGRNAYLIELDEHYCQVIIDRYKTFTGKDDVKKIRNINE
ncbi:MAG: site-specific DNA-methyltransferase, partial [Bacteroidetes bacterium]|nr:site-specific DNA-methyltransferase [Bacteroidota bacterium]